MDDDDRRTLLKSEWDNFRYQDGLRWSRIQTVGFIEVALLTGAYANPPHIHILIRILFVILLSLAVGAICALAETDGRHARAHGQRASAMEEALGLPRLDRGKRVLGVSGHDTTRFCMGLIGVLNVGVFLHLLVHAL